MLDSAETSLLLSNYDIQLRHAWASCGGMTGYFESLENGQLKIVCRLVPHKLIPRKYSFTANGQKIIFQSPAILEPWIISTLLPMQALFTHYEILLDDIELNENTPLIEISAKTDVGGHEIPWYRRMWVAPSWGPVPPDDQMRRVGLRNNLNPVYAWGLGSNFHHKLKQLAKLYGGKELYDFESILDWGCGYGRMARFFPPEHRHKVTGADIDPINIEWAQKNMPDIDFQVVKTTTPTQFKEGQFDFIYGNSVFTHMIEEDQFAWLAELKRITRPGGIVAVTVHGHYSWSFSGKRTAEDMHAILVDGFRKSGAANPDLTDVVGEFYTDVHHAHDYILAKWNEYFEILDILDGFSSPQDMVVLRRRAD